jgi:hypothetical protein
VFALFAVPHGGPSMTTIVLLIAAAVFALAAIVLLIMSWYEGRDEESHDASVLPTSNSSTTYQRVGEREAW